MYSFEPLDRNFDSIRLLILLPQGDKGRARNGTDMTDGHADEISCELEHRTLGSKPIYEALSYTWGEELVLKPIRVDGQPFFVRENLYNALQNFRLPTQRTLWVDAICINEADIQERNYQVSLMSYIYSRAQQVLVWLGDAPEPYTQEELKKTSSPTSWSVAKRNAISNHPYWWRRWAMQELILAKDAKYYLGQAYFTFEWQDLTNRKGDVMYDSFQRWRELIQKHRENRHTEEHRLEVLLETFLDTQCTERCDKIFALLGLANDADVIEVDYTIRYFNLYKKLIEFHQTSKPLPHGFDQRVSFSTVRKGIPGRPRHSRLKLTTEVDRSARLILYSQILQKTLDGAVEEDARTATDLRAPKASYLARGVLAGEISYLGLTYSEMASSWKANKAWKRALEEYCKDEPGLVDLRKIDEAYSRATLKWNQRDLESIRKVDTKTSYGYQQNAAGGFLPMGDHGPTREVQVSEPRHFPGTSNVQQNAASGGRPTDDHGRTREVQVPEPRRFPGTPNVQLNAAGGGPPTGDRGHGREVSTKRLLGTRNFLGKANKIWKKAVEELNKDEPGLINLGKEVIAHSRVTPKWNQKDSESIQKANTKPHYEHQQNPGSGFLPTDNHGPTREVPDPRQSPGTPNFQRNAEQHADRVLLPAGDQGHTREVSEPRRFLGTRNLLGFVPPEARVGDSICAFWESNIGVVVRRVGEDRWMIVGRADLSTEKLRDIIQGSSYGNALSRNMINFRLDLEDLQKLTS